MQAQTEITINDIAHEKKPSYSPNLHAWAKKHNIFKSAFGYGVFRVRAGTDAEKTFGADALLIGYVFDGDFLGCRLSKVLCNGAKQEPYSYSGFEGDIDRIDGFWDSYLEIGRCTIDPEHVYPFSGSERFSVNGDERTCLWCGKKEHKVSKPRVVYDDVWVETV